MNQKKVLGRGLGALIPQKEPLAASSAGVLEVPVARIDANPHQPRKHFDPAKIDELAGSIREHGIVQPLVVSRRGDRFQLIAGERRLRAAKKVGLTAVPAVIRETPEGKNALELALIENVQRQDLNAIEEAVAYQQLHNEFGLTQDEISKRVGKERSTVANSLRLLKLPEPVKKLVAEDHLSMGHARALLALESAKKIEDLAERVVRQHLNVRQTELLVAAQSAPPIKKTAKPKDVFTRDAEEKLARALRTKVEIDRKRRGGTIRVSFSSEEELIRLFEALASQRRNR